MWVWGTRQRLCKLHDYKYECLCEWFYMKIEVHAVDKRKLIVGIEMQIVWLEKHWSHCVFMYTCPRMQWVGTAKYAQCKHCDRDPSVFSTHKQCFHFQQCFHFHTRPWSKETTPSWTHSRPFAADGRGTSASNHLSLTDWYYRKILAKSPPFSTSSDRKSVV